MYVRIILLLILSLLTFSTQANNHKEYGQRADNFKIDIATIPEPKTSKSKKSYVMGNQFGFDVLEADPNWVMESFLNNLKKGDIVLDVGSGYGALTRQALNRNAIVISNDLSRNALLYNLKKITKEQFEHLYLNTQDIRKISLPKNSLDAIVFHRVLHFFSGSDIDKILSKSYQWLKPNGKIYIVMMSKDHIAFRDNIEYDYTKKWPGDDLVIVKKHLPDQVYALPQTLHVASVETLTKNLKNQSFKIEKGDYVSLKKVGTEKNRDGKEAVGIIGVK